MTATAIHIYGFAVCSKFTNLIIYTMLFEQPISKTKVRVGIYAYKYSNGCININGDKFFFYSIKDAIKLWRSKN